jgi:hypothetical protein
MPYALAEILKWNATARLTPAGGPLVPPAGIAAAPALAAGVPDRFSAAGIPQANDAG